VIGSCERSRKPNLHEPNPPQPNERKNVKKYLLALGLAFTLAMAFTEPLLAGTLVQENGAKFDLNKASPNMMQKHLLGSKVMGGIRIAKAKYDFAVQGGAQTTFNLVGEDGKPVVLPSGAVVVDCLIDVLTAGAAGGSGTMSLGTGQAGNDLKSVFAAASYTGRVACVPVGTAATAIKLTADRTMTGTIATTNWTQGKFWVYVYYILGGT